MERIKEWIMRNLVYGGVSKDEYENAKPLIRRKNKDTFCLITLLLGVLFLGLFLGSLFYEVMKSGKLLYVSVFLLMMVLQAIFRKSSAKKMHLILPAWYVLLTVVCCYAIGLNTFVRPDLASTTFCVVLIAAPFLIIDRPYRLIVYLLAVWVTFLIAVWRAKIYYLAFTDTCNSLCCLLLGAVIYIHIVKVKVHDIVQGQYLKSERDMDKLTGVLNKAAIEREIGKVMKSGKAKGALLIIDMDNFKYINDTYGHVYGDTVLRLMGGCILKCADKHDLCGRFGGDEFLIYLNGETDKKKISERANAFCALINQSILMPEAGKHAEVSIGIAVFENGTEDYQELFRRADRALYRAKEAGKNRYRFFGS